MSQAILLEAFPKEEHGKAMALFGIGVVFGPIIGPTLGGWITDNWGWPWVFYINIPLGVLGIALGLMHITDPTYLRRPEGKVDYLSFLFICLGLGSLEVVLNRGQRYDWFDSNLIKLFALAAAFGIALFIWRSFTAKSPLVNLRVFANRSFASGTVLMFLLGFGLYGSFTMLPIYTQSLMGYTATWAGLVISPGGIASLLAMGLVGGMVGKVDARFLVFVGAIFNIGALWVLKDLNLQVDFFHITLSRLFQGFGLGFLFVPITAAAFSHLKPEQIGQGTGLFNLLRNEGGSVGIAMSATVLARHAQLHQTRLADHVTSFNPIVQNRLADATHSLFAVSGHDPVTSQALALQMMYGQVQQQAAMLAFVDVFRMLMFAFVLFLPFILLLSGSRGGRGPGVH
jgi:DHA2 family multidrug resistance protein